MKELYITDLDGTLLNDKAVLTEKSKKYINLAIKNGALFSIATARTFATVMQMFSDVNLNLPVVLMNGVMLYNPVDKKIISYHSISNSVIDIVFEIYKKYTVYPLVYRCLDSFLEIEYYNTDNLLQMKYVDQRTDVSGKKFIYSPFFSSEGKKEVIYIVSLDKYEKLLPVYEEIKKLKDISCVFYCDNYTDCYFLEVFAGGVSKASGILDVKKLSGSDKVIAFGDNLNDIEMFKIADEAYAVKNSHENLKKYATDIIGSNENDSVAEFTYNKHKEI